LAKPRVFVSSTFYDLRHVRDDLGRFISEQGYEAVLFERGGVPYGRKERREDSCLKEIDLCDVVVSLIGGRFGGQSADGRNSISQKELTYALEAGKQVYVFVDKGVLSEYETYKANRNAGDVKYFYVDDVRVYQFLEEVLALPCNNPVFDFSYPQDITRILREQWAGLFQRLLQEEAERPPLQLLSELKTTAMTLRQVAMALVGPKEHQSSVIRDILLLNHPAFSAICGLLRIRHRIVFTDITELDALLRVKNYKKLDEEEWDEPNVVEWMGQPSLKNAAGASPLLKVSKMLFADDGQLHPLFDGQWNDSLVRLEWYSPDDSDDEDIPF